MTSKVLANLYQTLKDSEARGNDNFAIAFMDRHERYVRPLSPSQCLHCGDDSREVLHPGGAFSCLFDLFQGTISRTLYVLRNGIRPKVFLHTTFANLKRALSSGKKRSRALLCKSRSLATISLFIEARTQLRSLSLYSLSIGL